MKSLLMVAFFMLLIAFYQNTNNSSESYNESVKKNKATLFLNYTTAFDDYYLANSSSSGDVTSKVTLPAWIPANNTIRMYISGGYGYVYMPLENGVLTEVMKATDFSSLVGISNTSAININSGTITKPAFIPSGYIVYVR